jgi:sugar lactone lactonase YvrE
LILLLCSAAACDPANPGGTTAPADTTAPDVTDSTTPEETTAAPTEEPTAETTEKIPEDATVAPEETTADPTETTGKPTETTGKPEETTKKPAETTKKPAETTKKPAETTQKPAETTKKPAETTQKPAETTKKPEETTKEPEVTTKPDEPTVPTGNQPSVHIPEKGTLKATMTELFKIADHRDANGVHCRVVQGGCTDGTYYYVGLNSGVKTLDSISAIHKYEIATGKLVKTYEGVKASHCNDMVYNHDTHELLIVHNQPDREHISVFDPDTLEYKRTITVDHEIYGLAYDPYEGCYWVGISHGFTFARLDLDFKTVAVYDSPETGYTHQGIDSDDKYVYLVKYNSNAIMVHRKDGSYVREIPLPVTSNEAENIFHIGDTLYVGYYKPSAGGMLYKLSFETVSDTEVTLSGWKEYKTVPVFTGADSIRYTNAQGSCTDGNYLYIVLNNNNSSAFRSALHKIDLRTGETVQIYENLETGQTNDMTYNPNTREILISTDNPDKTTVMILDAETMTLKETKHLPFKIYAITYDPAKDCYWVGTSGNYNFACLDLNLKQIGSTYPGYSTGATKQALACDGSYLYFVHSAANTLVAYSTDGTIAAVVPLPERSGAAQSIAIADGVFYIGYHVANVGCVIYTVTVTVTK